MKFSALLFVLASAAAAFAAPAVSPRDDRCVEI